MRFHQILVSREIGGAGLIALGLAKFTEQQGQQTRVWIPDEGPALRSANTLGLQAETYELEPALERGKLRAGLANWRLGRRLRRQGPGLLHIHGPCFYGALRWGLKRSGLKRVVHVQLEESHESLHWAFRQPPELIITCARFLVDDVRRALPASCQEKQRIVDVPNAVDTSRFCPSAKFAAKKHVGAPAETPLILMLANLAPHKGQETAIRAVALLKKRGTAVRCWLAGTERGGHGAYTARLQTLIRALDVGDRVQLLGQRQDTPELLRAADLFLLPSTCEGLPLSILEAQATKVPVLAAPTAGIPEIITEGETGFLIAADDDAGYAERVARLLGHPELYQRVADQAYRRATVEHTWSTLCERIWRLYQEVLQPHQVGLGAAADSMASAAAC